ncbi:MAG TPA: hypothetical protein VLZ30_03945 [Verrucomicrobiae bacterium]|nr:hypothetical protein [Verrucomicrobiae bacterium]
MAKSRLLFLGVLLSILHLPSSIVSAQNLPTFDDFRRVDRLHLAVGVYRTEDLFKPPPLNYNLIQNAARQATNDYQIVWGAAELIGDWPTKRALFDSALTLSRTNLEVTLRYACAAANNLDLNTAVPLLHLVEKQDPANIVPWFVEWYAVRVQVNRLANVMAPPLSAVQYQDYAADAARARIRTLEAAGCSAYSARRIGFMPDMFVVAMARDWVGRPIEIAAAPMLLTMARAMQNRPVYLATEMVGQSLELAAVAAGAPDPTRNAAKPRSAVLFQRRNEIQALLSSMERSVVDLATEPELIHYFDNVLALGEEAAIRRLSQRTRGGQTFPGP